MKRKTASWLLCFVLLISIGSISAFADRQLVPVGEAVGIRLDIGGVVVADVSEVETDAGSISPAARAGLKKGDIITAVNGRTVEDAAAFITSVSNMDGSAVKMTVMDSGIARTIDVIPAKCCDGEYRLGVWLRDSICGVGTMTYYDPATGEYGALGHGVCDGEDKSLMNSVGGTLTQAKVVDVIKGREGTPGELCGSANDSAIGSIERNTDRGIFGTLESWNAAGAIPVGEKKDIHLGPAKILSTVSGDGVREYDVEICRVYHDPSSTRSMMISVTDPALLAATGGIVQGMSGSPVIQDGKLIGAVTHVLVSDPTRGYGIAIEDMLQAV